MGEILLAASNSSSSLSLSHFPSYLLSGLMDFFMGDGAAPTRQEESIVIKGLHGRQGTFSKMKTLNMRSRR